MYALTASAAGVGTLALAQRAQAKIMYTPAHSTVPINSFLPVDLNHDGVNDLSFTIAAGGKSSFLFAYNLRSNGVVGGEVQNQRFASALKRGAHIGTRRKFLNGSNRISCGVSGPAPVQSGVQENGETPLTTPPRARPITVGCALAFRFHRESTHSSPATPTKQSPNIPIVAGRTKV
jgi:hypothetical protein